MATPAPLASVQDLADWLGDPIEDPGTDPSPEYKRAALALRMASALVRLESRRTWCDDDGQLIEPLPEAVTIVTLSAAGRGYTNPRAVEDLSESVDDYNHRERVKLDEASMYLTRSEKELLAPFAGTLHGGLGTVSTSRGDLVPMWDDEGNERLLPPWY